MVWTLEPLGHHASQIGQGISQNGAAGSHPFEGIDARKAVGPGGKTTQEMAQQGLVIVFAQDIENKAITHLHQGLNRPIFGHGHCDPRRLEAGLTHPAGNHGATALTFGFPGRDDVEASRQPPHRFVQIAIDGFHRSNRFLTAQQLTQVSAGLLAALVVGGIGHLADAQGREGLGLAHAAQLACHRVNGLVVAAEDVVAAHPLLGFEGRQQGTN